MGKKSQFTIRDADHQIIGNNDNIIQEIAYEFLDEYNQSPLQHLYIPDDPNEFLADFGGLPHPYKKDSNGMPQTVNEWTWYQLEAWGEQNTIMVSSNKVGKTTSFSIEDFQSRLKKKHAGKNLLLVAQNQKMANEHLLDLKKMVRASPKYRQFLIERPDQEMFKEEKSKLETMYIRNPWDPLRPSRILALGGSEASAYSWKNVDWIHMSDVSQLTSNNQKLFFGAMFSRLANTDGVAKIETIPGAKEGEVWRIWKEIKGIKEKSDKPEDLAEDSFDLASTFKSIQVTVYDARDAGLVTQNYIDKIKAMVDDYTFRQLFMAEFVEIANQWYQEQWLKDGDYGAD